jgi:gluconolactonase
MTQSAGSAHLDGLVDPAAEVALLGDGFLFTEGLAWSTSRQELVFSDIPSDARWTWSDRDGLTRIAFPTNKANGLVLEADGSLLACEHLTNAVARFGTDGRREVIAFHLDGRYLNSPNDIVVRSDGLVLFTDPVYGRWDVPVGLGRACDLDFQGVYAVAPDGTGLRLLVAQDEFEQPNGLCFSPDESILYVNDSPRGHIKAFDVAADGSLSGGRVLHDGIGDGTIGGGIPDGMKSDARGNLWCTGASGVVVVSPDGARLGEIAVPEPVGNLCFGGEDLQTLFLGSSTSLRSIRTLVPGAALPGV